MDVTLAKRMRLARKRAGLTQGQVAAYEETTPPNISYLESDDEPESPLANWLRRLSKRYRVSTDWLLGLTDDPTPVTRRELSPELRELRDIVDKLSDARRQELIALARAMLETQEERRRWLESNPELKRQLTLIELRFGEETRRRAEDMA